MCVMGSLAVFLKNVPLWFLYGGLFLPVTLLLLLLILHLRWKLQEVEMELSRVRDPRDTAEQLTFTPKYTHTHHHTHTHLYRSTERKYTGNTASGSGGFSGTRPSERLKP